RKRPRRVTGTNPQAGKFRILRRRYGRNDLSSHASGPEYCDLQHPEAPFTRPDAGLLLADTFEEPFDRVHPSFGARIVLVATGINGLVQLAKQLFLLLRKADRRFHDDTGKQVAGTLVAHGYHALAAQAENLAGLRPGRNFERHMAVERR